MTADVIEEAVPSSFFRSQRRPDKQPKRGRQMEKPVAARL
jgi:hypothetical protein